MKLQKMMAVALTASVALSLFTACNKSTTESSGNDAVEVISTGATASQQALVEHSVNDEGYCFEVNGAKVRVNADLNEVLAKLPQDYVYFEAPSCAGIGMTKTYTFNNGSYVISTVPLGTKDLVSNIVLFNDSVTTPEGIFVGSKVDDVKKAYGTPTSDIDGILTFEKNDTMLVINTDGDIVSGVVYNSIM